MMRRVIAYLLVLCLIAGAAAAAEVDISSLDASVFSYEVNWTPGAADYEAAVPPSVVSSGGEITLNTVVIPEPATLILLTAGSLALIRRKRRR